MKIRPVGVWLFLADGRMDRHDEANSRFSRLFESAYTDLLILIYFYSIKVLRFSQKCVDVSLHLCRGRWKTENRYSNQ